MLEQSHSIATIFICICVVVESTCFVEEREGNAVFEEGRIRQKLEKGKRNHVDAMIVWWGGMEETDLKREKGRNLLDLVGKGGMLEKILRGTLITPFFLKMGIDGRSEKVSVKALSLLALIRCVIL